MPLSSPISSPCPSRYRGKINLLTLCLYRYYASTMAGIIKTILPFGSTLSRQKYFIHTHSNRVLRQTPLQTLSRAVHLKILKAKHSCVLCHCCLVNQPLYFLSYSYSLSYSLVEETRPGLLNRSNCGVHLLFILVWSN